MVDSFKDISFNYDLSVVSFKMATNLCIDETVNYKTLEEIIKLCYKVAKSINFLERAFYNYKLDKKLHPLSKTPSDEAIYHNYVHQEIKNFTKVIDIYKEEVRTGHFPFKILSCKNQHVTMVRDMGIVNDRY